MNILWVPHAPWRTPQRARFFAETLSARHRVHVIDYDADFTRLQDFLSKRYARNFFPRRWESAGVSVHHLPRVSPALFSQRLRQLNAGMFRRTLDRVIREGQIDVVVGTFVAPHPDGAPTVTDVFDDNAGFWQSYGLNKGYAREIADSEERWIRGSQSVVTVSSVLAESVRARSPGSEVVHIANGVDLSRYVPDKHTARRVLGLPGGATLVGNIGALDHEHEALRVLAVAERLRGLPGAEVLVAGRGAAMPLLEREAARRGLSNLRNVGFLSGDALLLHFQALDIGLCPYSAISPGDHARVPMRLLHYSATGSRVVCTRLTEVERMGFENVVLTADTDEAFAQGVLEALDRPVALPSALDRYDQGRLSRAYEAVLERAATRTGGHAGVPG
jgi:glycosyltransferase involved in cell wall biosynthesis